MDELQQWQSRPLEALYRDRLSGCLFVKMRHEGRVENRAVYVAVGVRMDGFKDVLRTMDGGHGTARTLVDGDHGASEPGY